MEDKATHINIDGTIETITVTGMPPGEAKKLLDSIINATEDEIQAAFQE
jgi:hypothetical protein